MTYLDGTVSFANNLQLYPLSVLVQDDLGILDRYDCTGLFFRGVFRGVGMREDILVWDGQEAAVQGFLEITVVGADRVVDGNEVGARGKGSFDLKLDQRVDYGREDMTATEDSLAQGHKICHGVVAIADKLSHRVTLVCTRIHREEREVDQLLGERLRSGPRDIISDRLLWQSA
jgi:hypothetical protein